MKTFALYTYPKGSTRPKGTLVATVDANRAATAIRRHFGDEIRRFDTKAPNYATLNSGERVQAVRA